MNVLSEAFGVTRHTVQAAITARYEHNRPMPLALDYAFSLTHLGWEAYGIVPAMLRYLDNCGPARFSDEAGGWHRNEDQRDTLLAFLLIWVDEDHV